MTDNSLPDDNHIVRYVKGSYVDEDKVHGNAFLLKPNEHGLSVNWLEIFGSDDQDFQVNEVRRFIQLRISRP